MHLRAGSMAGRPKRSAKRNSSPKEKQPTPGWMWPILIVVGITSMFSMRAGAWVLVISAILVFIVTVVWLIKTGQVKMPGEDEEEEEVERPEYRYEQLTPEDLNELEQEFK